MSRTSYLVYRMSDKKARASSRPWRAHRGIISFRATGCLAGRSCSGTRHLPLHSGAALRRALRARNSNAAGRVIGSREHRRGFQTKRRERQDPLLRLFSSLARGVELLPGSLRGFGIRASTRGSLGESWPCRPYAHQADPNCGSRTDPVGRATSYENSSYDIRHTTYGT